MAQSISFPKPITSGAKDEQISIEAEEVQIPPAPETAKTSGKVKKNGLSIPRKYTKKEMDAFNMLEYEMRSSKITEPDGTVIFEMHDIEVPTTWSQLATDIIAQKYFRKAGVPKTGHETSVKQVVHRIVHTIRTFGENHGYFTSEQDANTFEQELKYLLIAQYGAFNSPVWFNCGLYHEYNIQGDSGNFAWDFTSNAVKETKNAYEHPQCSACFIQKVEDSLLGIFELAKTEAKLFKYGSGTGSNFSSIRSKYENLSGGGISSGLMSFLEVLDRGAGAIKSGGTTRRAAKMVILDVDHPEIREFISWKVESEKKAKALIDAGYDSDWRGEAYRTVSGQNSNNSVRVTDEFMQAVDEKSKYWTRFRTTGENYEETDANEIFDQICSAAWQCADPGLQFDSTINKWHTCPVSGRINGSNPCSEYMFLDDSACNLASINLIKFLKTDGSFDVEGFRHATRLFFIAQEILIDLSSYPTEEITQNSHDYRPLGIGYANLGTLLMMMGIPYDSEEGRVVAAAITAIEHNHAYSVSAEMAGILGTFTHYEKNAKPMQKVIKMHRDAAHQIDKSLCPKNLYEAACEDGDNAVKLGEKNGYRNSQATVLAPTGTIGLLMDCDTTGIEPEFSLVKWKKLAGGGYFKIINTSIPASLNKLGYNEKQISNVIDYVLGHGTLENAPHVNPEALEKLGFTKKQILTAEAHIEKAKTLDEWTPNIDVKTLKTKGLTQEQIEEAKVFIEGNQTVEGAPHLKPEHLAIFDCANRCGKGSRYIAPLGHVKMMGAVQPFLSGAISKTVNIPNEATEKDIYDIYMQGWRLGLKAIALYRDGSKHSQALSSQESKTEEAPLLPEGTVLRGSKVSLPTKRRGITVEANVGGQKMYLRTGEYHDGKPGEIFIDSFKEGASYRSLLNCFAVAVSIGLQYGVPLEKYVDSFTFTRFEPSGFTTHPNIRTCTSIVDFIFRVLGMEYLGRTDFVHVAPETTQLEENNGKGRIKEAMRFEAEVTIEETLISEKADITTNAMDKQLSSMMGDAPPCSVCGHVTVRNASCYKCLNCGASNGCS
ncbi:vitamin B12-dependent ribonucleotide reductase [Patescibacteria group bacterium]|nr:vitamin B12-dependent ribonucleotide reductase [Patescibacteria group bacterium]